MKRIVLAELSGEYLAELRAPAQRVAMPRAAAGAAYGVIAWEALRGAIDAAVLHGDMRLTLICAGLALGAAASGLGIMIGPRSGQGEDL